MEELNVEELKNSLRVVLFLEYIGIHIEKSVQDDFEQVIYFYFSVPEKSILKLKGYIADKIHTSEDLIKVAKDTILKMIVDPIKSEIGDEPDEFDKEFLENIEEHVKFYAKVREGEIWNEELAKAALEELTDSLYKEV